MDDDNGLLVTERSRPGVLLCGDLAEKLRLPLRTEMQELATP